MSRVRRLGVVFALVLLVAMTNLGQRTTAMFLLGSVAADFSTGISRSSRNCRVTTRVNTREVYDDGYESRKHANSHVSVAPPVMLELVLAGHEYATDFQSHYLWDLALSNVNIVLYRRQRADLPLRTWSNGCGMRAEELLLLLNHGRDAAAFYDYAAWRYDTPPQAVAFLHGHGALAWHTSCETVFTRITAYHEHLLRRNASSSAGVLEVDGNFLDTTMVTLTFARGRKETQFEPLKWNGGKKRRLLRTSYVDAERHPETSGRHCRAVLDKVGVTPLKRALVTSCCGSFILPGKLLRLHDKKLYERLFDYVADTTVDDRISARECFEFIVYGLFAVDDDGSSAEEDVAKLQTWFENTRRTRRKLGAKLKRCERNYGAFYLGDSRRTIFGGRIWFPSRRYVQGLKRM